MEYFRVGGARPFDVWTYSDVDHSQSKGRIRNLVYAWDFPSTVPLLQDTRYFFLPLQVGDALAHHDLSGFELSPVETRKSEDYYAAPGQSEPPQTLYRLLIHGTPGEDDMGIQGRTRLILSERALAVFFSYPVEELEVVPYDPDWRPLRVEELPAQGRSEAILAAMSASAEEERKISDRLKEELKARWKGKEVGAD